MKVKIEGLLVDVVDADCEFRPCYALGFDKGSYSPGVGYTRYHEDGRGRRVEFPVCMTRHLNGCPLRSDVWDWTCGACRHVQREPMVTCSECGSDDVYRVAVTLEPTPCCSEPRVRKYSGYPPLSQRCRSCGTMLKQRRLAHARNASGIPT